MIPRTVASQVSDLVLVQQLNDMGFTNASQNVRALLATAGNVHSAIEYILGGGGL
jgi:ubiquilin